MNKQNLVNDNNNLEDDDEDGCSQSSDNVTTI